MDAEFAYEVLEKAPYVTVSFIRPDGTAYGVPLSLARGTGDVFYFHCALEGEKLDCIRHDKRVSLSAVSRCKPTAGPLDGSFTLEYRSAMAKGLCEIVEDREEKIEALRLVCERFLPHHMDHFDESIERSLGRTVVVRITLSEPPTGKSKEYDEEGQEKKWGRK